MSNIRKNVRVSTGFPAPQGFLAQQAAAPATFPKSTGFLLLLKFQLRAVFLYHKELLQQRQMTQQQRSYMGTELRRLGNFRACTHGDNQYNTMRRYHGHEIPV
jgi:CRISPR/Cas system-associated protein endoribonuclease Cas2